MCRVETLKRTAPPAVKPGGAVKMVSLLLFGFAAFFWLLCRLELAANPEADGCRVTEGAGHAGDGDSARSGRSRAAGRQRQSACAGGGVRAE